MDELSLDASQITTGTLNPALVPDLATLALVGRDIDDGEATMPRRAVVSTAVALATGTMRLAGFTAQISETITAVRIPGGSTAAGATPSLIRVGIYTVDTNGDLTLTASTPSDTALLATQSTSYTKTLSASLSKVRGQRYMVGVLVITAAAAPTLCGVAPGGSMSGEGAILPKAGGTVSGLSDLPSTVAVGSITASSLVPYLALIR